ncbi:hypothetical protein XENOCAPTIV_005828, partial [Xenoophorus captivus]
MAVFPSHHPLHHLSASLLTDPQPPRSAIEMLLFPAMSFVQAGRLSSLEIVTQELSSQIHIRFQTYRPKCPGQHLLLPSCGGPACASVAVCAPGHTLTKDPPSCPAAEQWCPFQGRCLALSNPCHPSSCTNCTRGHHLPPGTSRPQYTLKNEIAFTLQAGRAHVLVSTTEPSYPSSASCPLRVVPPLGLTILHPSPNNGTLYMQPNNTRLVLRVQSHYETRVSRRGSDHSVTFQSECPAEFLSSPTVCEPGWTSGSAVEVSEPVLYAVLDLSLRDEEHKGPVQVELEAHNNVTEASLTVVVYLEEPLQGLVVQPDPGHRVLMESVVVGIYTALVSVSNRYENVSQSINMSVYSILTRVDIQTEPQFLLAGKSADFEAHPLPSPYGIHYNWNFGDGSAFKQGRRVAHTFSQSGVFNVCVSVNNTISFTSACAEIFVYEEIEDLTAKSSSPTELQSPTTVWAYLGSGNNITWMFSMGDGTSYTASEPRMSHHYIKEGNYTVNVTAMNAVSSGWTLLTVHVFVFQVIRMEPSVCVQERTKVNFQAWVSGNATIHLYQWSFGDGSPNETHQGNPSISHTYQSSGNYNLSLLLSSGVNKATKANFINRVCVQPALTNISFVPEKSHYAVGEEVHFKVTAEPASNYSYRWDFGREEGPFLIHGSGNVLTKYKKPGHYLVTVHIFNNISANNASAVIDVLVPIGPILIRHNGTKHNNLSRGFPYTFTTSSLASDVTYSWSFGDGNVLTGQSILYTYNVSGNYNITMKAANSVSQNETVLLVTVLAPILRLKVNASLVNVPLNASVHFEAYKEEGDGVHYSWILCDRCTSIPGTHNMFYTFRSIGAFNIIVIAENDVGTAHASISLFVQRELEGLRILAEDIKGGGSTALESCCYATNSVLHLQAGLKEGTNMTFSWNIVRELDPDSSFNSSGKMVELIFSKPGPCDISLRAENLLGQLLVNKTIYFVEPPAGVSLMISNNPVATGVSTNLTVDIVKGSDLKYRWSIDGRNLQCTEPGLTYTFNSPGIKQVSVEAFNEVSSEITSKVIHVQDKISGLSFSGHNDQNQSFVETGVGISLEGQVKTGTDVRWTWLVDGRTRSGRQTFLNFTEPKTAIVTLNATNDVSSEAFSREFIAQDGIKAELKASKSLAAVNEKVEFTPLLMGGTDVNLILIFTSDAKIYPLPNKTYTHAFSRVDTYMVNLIAYNK